MILDFFEFLRQDAGRKGKTDQLIVEPHFDGDLHQHVGQQVEIGRTRTRDSRHRVDVFFASDTHVLQVQHDTKKALDLAGLLDFEIFVTDDEH